MELFYSFRKWKAKPN